MTWKSNSICTSTVQLFLLSCGWVRTSQSTWTSVLAGRLPITLFWLLPHAGKWGKGKRGCWWPPCSPTPRAASSPVCCGSCFFCIWNSLAQAAWSLGWWVRTAIAGVIPVSVWVRAGNTVCAIWKGRFLALPCSLEVSGCTLCAWRLSLLYPCSGGVEGNPNSREGGAYAFTLQWPWPSRITSPWKSAIWLSLKKLSVSLSNCLLKPHKGWI